MKKLMTLTACALIAGLASAAVESPIVGYVNLPIEAGYKGYSPSFIPVGSKDGILTLRDIVPTGFSFDDADQVTFFNSDGEIVLTVTYYDGEGWIDPVSDADLNATPLSIGNGIFASVKNKAHFLSSGEVIDSGVDVKVPKGYAFLGNPLPIDLTLEDVLPSDSFSFDNSDQVVFFDLDGFGYLTATYSDELGWIDPVSDDYLGTTPFPIGEAVYVSAEYESTFSFPALSQE